MTASTVTLSILRDPPSRRIHAEAEGRRATGDVLIVGRGDGADLRLSDPSVSSMHIELRGASESLVAVRDLGSRNGTWLGGARLVEAEVPSGSELRVGQTTIRVGLGELRTVEATERFGELRGASRAMREVFERLRRIAPSELSVLVQGPTGTGKELAARALHAASPRAEGPFVVVDATSIPASLAESLLFGHEKGAFTGATSTRAGLFESAHGGTVFLDEIAELPLALQPKLLRVLERREVVRVGSSTPRPIDVRVVSATWRDLRRMVNAGEFREDLYFRLAHAFVELPALDAHREDVPLLVAHFLATDVRGVERARQIAPDALASLMRRAYPGNVRELRATVLRAAVLASGPLITLDDLAAERLVAGPHHDAAREEVVGDESLEPFKDAKRAAVQAFERRYLEALLARAGDNVSAAARLAGLERHSIRDLFERHGLRDR